MLPGLGSSLLPAAAHLWLDSDDCQKTFFKEPEKSASLSSPSQRPLELPISLPLQDRPCIPLALPEGELSQIPRAREGLTCPRLCGGGGEPESHRHPWGRDVQMFRVFHLKWFLMCLAEWLPGATPFNIHVDSGPGYSRSKSPESAFTPHPVPIPSRRVAPWSPWQQAHLFYMASRPGVHSVPTPLNYGKKQEEEEDEGAESEPL